MLRLLACVLITDDAHDERVDADGDGAIAAAYGGDDCDDGNAAITPAATETCDGVDNDCDGAVDDGAAAGATTWYADEDADGFGGDSTTLACELPAGHASSTGDCDDARADIYPGAEEACTADDQDCDGLPGNDDGDGDGFAACEDCDPRNTNVHPDATEACNDLDDDCDGGIDEEGGDTWYADGDADGFGGAETTACDQPAGHVTDGGDCDDGDALTYPGAEEDCSVGIDRNCDERTGLEDADGDGVRACDDCDDGNATIFPGAAELCDGVDEDCDGTADDEAMDRELFYADVDGDGFGDAAVPVLACELSEGYVVDSTDCDDADAAVTDGSVWYSDGDGDGYGVSGTGVRACSGVTALDGDCNDTDAALNPGTIWYADADGDGFGDPGETWTACVGPSGYLLEGTDCDDGDEAVFPGAEEGVGDEVDSDCDGGEVCFADLDLDGWAGSDTVVSADLGCDGVGEGVVEGDCEDGDDSVYPTAVEGTGDEVDQDCDGAESCWLDSDGDGYGVGTAVASPDLSCAEAGESPSDADCDDADAAINPGVTDVPTDGIDNDCNGTESCFADTDGDGYGASTTVESVDADCSGAGESADDGDCDEGDSSIHPWATEICEDGIDQDCREGAVGCGVWSGNLVSDGDAWLYCGYNKTCGASADAEDIDGDGEIDIAYGATINELYSWQSYSAAGWVPGPFSGKIDAHGVGLSDDGYWYSDQGSSLGSAIAVIHDVDGDGRRDILVGDPSKSRVLVLPGDASASYPDDAETSALANLNGETEWDYGGTSVSEYVDVDGDGFDEYLVGAPASDFKSSNDGSVYVVDGSTSGSHTITDVALARIHGATVGAGAGARLSLVGDLDSDGLDDLVIPDHESTPSEVFVFLSPVSADVGTDSADVTFSDGSTEGNRIGEGTSGDADFDGDGRSDLLVGAPGVDDAGDGAGAVYLVTDVFTAAGDLAGTTVISGDSDNDGLGSMLAAGDYDGDGNPDVAAGLFSRSYVYMFAGPFGGSTTVADYDGYVLAYGYYGATYISALSNAGDTDGDGTDDLLVGDETYSPSSGEWQTGIVSIFLGAAE